MEVDGKYYPPDKIFYLSQMEIDLPTEMPKKKKPSKDNIDIILDIMRSGGGLTIE